MHAAKRHENLRLPSGGLESRTETYSCDTANRLKTVAQRGNNYAFTCNGLGDWVSETVNTATTTYAVDPAAGLTQVLAGTGATSSYYFYGVGRIAEQQTAGWAYHLPDVLGS